MSENSAGGRESEEKTPMGPKRGPIVIAESLDLWFTAYMVLIAFLLLGALSEVGVAGRYSDFITAFTPFETGYTYALATLSLLFTFFSLLLTLYYRNNPIVQGRRIRIFVRARSFVFPLMVVLFGVVAAFLPMKFVPSNIGHTLDVAGGYLAVTLFALISIIGPGLLIYIVNPAAARFFLEYPFGYREKLRILARFPDYPELTSSRFSFLLAEAARDTWVVIRRGFPHIDPIGVDDTFVDIQVAMRLGELGERGAVAEFFSGVEQIQYRIGTIGYSYSSQVLSQLHLIRGRLPTADEFRRRNNLKGLWRMSLLDYLKPYEGVILMALTLGLLAVEVYLILVGR